MSTPSLSTRVRDLLLDLLRDHAVSGAVGVDAYHPEPSYHAMAEAKYLLALRAAADSGLVSMEQTTGLVEKAVERLTDHALRPMESHRAWGLGFAHGGNPADEPYVITTVLVAEALTAHNAFGTFSDGVKAFLQWMLDDHSTPADDGTPIVHYSPGNEALVHNVVAKASALLQELGMRDIAAGSARWVMDGHCDPWGWPYTPDHSRVDLLHNGYILRGVAWYVDDYRALSELTLRMLHAFSGDHGLRDKLNLVGTSEAMAAWQRSSSVVATPNAADSTWAVIPDGRASVWGLGETLALLGELHHAHPNQWSETWIRRLLQAVVDDAAFDRAVLQQPRQAMHLAHGLAQSLAALRGHGDRAEWDTPPAIEMPAISGEDPECVRAPAERMAVIPEPAEAPRHPDTLLATKTQQLAQLRSTLLDTRRAMNAKLEQARSEIVRLRREVDRLERRTRMRNVDAIAYNTPGSMDEFFTDVDPEPYIRFGAALRLALRQAGVGLDGRSVADAGIGPGHALHELLRGSKPSHVTGFDFSRSALDEAQRLFPEADLQVRGIYDDPIGRFDVVVCTEVLEHLERAHVALLTLRQMITDHGTLVLTVPDGRIDFSEKHVNFWSPESWGLFLRQVLPDDDVQTDVFSPYPETGHQTNLGIVRAAVR